MKGLEHIKVYKVLLSRLNFCKIVHVGFLYEGGEKPFQNRSRVGAIDIPGQFEHVFYP